MPVLRSALLLSMMMLIGGCSTLLSQSGGLNTQVDSWVAEHRYDRALDALHAVPPDHPGFNSLTPRIAEIESLRRDYIEQQLADAAEFEAEGNWSAAIDLLDEALEKLPDAPELIRQREAYEQRRLHSIQLSQRAIAMHYGRYLLATRPSEEKLLQASPDGFFAQQRYRSYQQELNQSSRGLYAVGRQALYENDNETAIEALTLSNQLAPNDLSEDLLSNIRQAQRDERQQQRQQEAATAKQQLPQLQAQFEQSLRFNDLIGARRLLGEIEEIDAEASANLQPRLQRRIDAEATALLERGRLLYGQGLLQEAIAVWREALQLKPDDPELLAAIERTETFLQNLENWGE